MPDENKSGVTALFEKYLRDIVFVVMLTISAILFVVVPMKENDKQIALIQKDINTITSNHLSHIQDSLDKINQRDEKRSEEINKINNDITEIKTILLGLKNN